MSITASELIWYGSTNMPSGDGITIGGVINTSLLVIFDDPTNVQTLNDTVFVDSTNNADSGLNINVLGRVTNGTPTLNILSCVGTGKSSVSPSTFERILRVWVTGASAGSVRVKKNSTSGVLATLAGAAGVTGITRPLLGTASSPTANLTFYEKVFLKNTNATLALLNTNIAEAASQPTGITFAVADTTNDNQTATNRQTQPSLVSAFDHAAKNISGTNLNQNTQIGVWLKLTLPSGSAAQNTTYELDVTGQST